jgi:preprotein translocase subunit SecY
VLTAFARAFKTPDLRRRFCSPVDHHAVPPRRARPTPGVSYPLVQQCISRRGQQQRAARPDQPVQRRRAAAVDVFALGIMPYITASIIVQLLDVVIPRFEALKKEGQAGQTKMTQYTRYLTIGAGRAAGHDASSRWRADPAAVQGCARTSSATTTTILTMVLTMTAGTGVIMWMGELITDRGIGNGMSMLIFTHRRRLPGRCGRSSRPSGWDLHRHHPHRAGHHLALVIFVEQASAASRCSTPSGWWGVARCTAAPRPTSR